MTKSTGRGGKREGAGRPRRIAPKAYPIWCGQLSKEDRARILTHLSPEERRDALLDAVAEVLDANRTTALEAAGKMEGDDV